MLVSSMDEWASLMVPHAPREGAYARNRPPGERTPPPRLGDCVYYRHRARDRDVDRAVVIDVQSLDDYGDPNLWHLVRGVNGAPILDAGVPRVVRVADPWPWVLLRTETYGEVKTWESRLRGSPGWLPLNWRERKVRLPHQLVMQPLPALNVPVLRQRQEE